MAAPKYVNINSSELSSSVETVSEEIPEKKWWHLSPSPYPMYVANVFYFITMANNMVIVDAVLYAKLCYFEFHNSTLCDNSTFTSSQPNLQQSTATWGTYNLLAQLPFAILVNLVLSSYCDRVGHKLPYVSAGIGNFIGTFLLALMATPQFYDWPMWVVLVAYVVPNMFGNYSMVVMSSFSYVALITPKEKISVAMAICEGTLLLGMLIGTLINGPIMDATNLMTLTYINASLCLVAPIIILLFVRSVPKPNASQVSYTWRDVIGIKNALDAFKCVFKKREGHTALILHLSFVAFSLNFIANSGMMSNGYLYFVKERGLSMTEYSIYNGFSMAVKSIVGPFILFIFSKCSSPHRSDILMLCGTLIALGFSVMSINAIPHCIWIGGALLSAQTGFAGELRFLQTRLCDKTEFGQLMAYVALIQFLFGTLGQAFFKEIYSATLTVWPAFFLAIMALMSVISMVLVIVIDQLMAANRKIRSSSVDDDE